MRTWRAQGVTADEATFERCSPPDYACQPPGPRREPVHGEQDQRGKGPARQEPAMMMLEGPYRRLRRSTADLDTCTTTSLHLQTSPTSTPSTAKLQLVVLSPDEASGDSCQTARELDCPSELSFARPTERLCFPHPFEPASALLAEIRRPVDQCDQCPPARVPVPDRRGPSARVAPASPHLCQPSGTGAFLCVLFLSLAVCGFSVRLM